MSTIKFVPMEFFAQFGLTQMRRLQARGGVGAAFSGAGRGWWAQVAVCTAFPARGAYCERWALSARLSGSGNIVGGRGELLVGVGALLAGVGRCRRARGRCLRAWGAVDGRGSPFAELFQAGGSAAPSCARPRPSARRTVLAARPALWLHVPIPPSWCVLPRPPVGRTPPALPPRRVPLRRLTFPRKDATIISLFAAAWPSAERPTGCGAVW